MLNRIRRYLRTDVWRMDKDPKSRPRSFLVHNLRVFLVASQGFVRNNCSMRASALTFYTLLSIVPIMALVFGIAKGFGLEERLEQQLEQYLGHHEEVLEEAIRFAYSWLEVTRGDVIAGVSFLFLLWAVLKVLDNIEISFNAVWGIEEGRVWVRKFTDYLTFIIIAPILFVMSGSLSVFIATELHNYLPEFGPIEHFDRVMEWMAGLVPLIFMWLLFSFMFLAMPNTKVRIRPALAAGILTGTMFIILQWGYVLFQVAMVRYNAVYGSFAALPLFLIWLQASWMIVLMGSELSFGYQNVRHYIHAAESKEVSLRHKQKISLLVMHLIIKNFVSEEDSPGIGDICYKLGLPVLLANQVVKELMDAGLVVKVSEPGRDEHVYHPGKDVNRMSIAYVLKSLYHTGGTEVPVERDQNWAAISSALDRYEEMMEKSSENVLLKDIGQRA